MTVTDAHTAESDAPCRCEPYAYIGTQMVGTPTRCERCHGLVDDVAEARIDAAHAEALARLTRVTPPAPTKGDEQ